MTTDIRRRSRRRQYLAAACATLTTATAGTVTAWTSPSLPKLEEAGLITPEDSSWIASMYMLCSVASVLPAAYMAEKFGRKPTLLFGAIPYALGWVLILIARSSVEIYVSRMLSGLGTGVVYTLCPLYLGEIAGDEIRGSLASMITLMSKQKNWHYLKLYLGKFASDEIRGSLASMITFMSKGGILFEYSIGPYVSIKTLAAINLIIPILFVMLFAFQPESPHFHAKRGNREAAERSLTTLMGTEHIKADLDKIEALVGDRHSQAPTKWSELVTVAGNRRGVVILIVLYTVQQFCGSSAVIAYAQQIFANADGRMGAAESSIVLGGVQLAVALLSVLLVDRLGRKPLLIISCTGVAVTNVTLSVYFYLLGNDDGISVKLGWLPLVTVSLYIVSYTVGLATVPFAITSEIFPANVKSNATSVVQMYTGVATFAVIMSYQTMVDTLGSDVVFMFFGFVSIVGLIFVMFAVTETKGQSLSCIQDNINGKSKCDAVQSC